jgi:hypothetical protein
MSTTVKIISAILAVLAVAALVFLIGSSMSNIHNETTHPNTQQVCQIPERTTIDGFRFNPINCSWEEVQNTPAQEATATPTPTPTLTPTAPTATAHAAEQPKPVANSSCPTTAEVKNLTGVDVQRLGTESCAWVWRAVDQATTSAICPSGWVCTWDVVGDIVVVHLGVNQTATIRAGTWRFIDGYPVTDAVHNVCELYRKERDFGLSEVPPFKVRFEPAYDASGALLGPKTCP